MKRFIVSTLSFETRGNELLLCYEPVWGTEDIAQRLSSGEQISIKHAFWVTQELLRNPDEEDYDFEETLRFCIGQVGDIFTLLDSDVIGTEHSFYFWNEINLKPEMFIAYRNIAILRKIDKLVERDFYIGGDWENYDGISKEIFMELIKKFPKSAELDKYAHYRIANILKEYFPECDKYEDIYNKYISARNKSYVKQERTVISEYNLQIELEQFTVAYYDLQNMLEGYEAIDEKQWQVKIHNILQLLYPKYICCVREIKYYGMGKHDKQPDFLLVDANGFVDILEIKKADILLLTKYRNNYVASRELSGAIQQIEKYIYCLNSSDKAKDDVSSKLALHLPIGLKVQVVNPQGILILGRSNELNIQQKQDFELIKRQYKHIADIMTYDDLINRLENIVCSLKARLALKEEEKK